MPTGPGSRFRLLRRLTLAATAVSVGLGALVYVGLSGLIGGVTDAIAAGIEGSGSNLSSPVDAGVSPQPPAANPGAGTGTPVARTGGS